MRISLNWLGTFLDIDKSKAAFIADSLTNRGIEVESIEYQGKGLEKVFVGKILARDKHPNADKLSVLSVDVGKETLQIVCGASNMKAGDKVAVSIVGAELPNGLVIKKSKIRDVESCGMCCSETELGLAKESEGIIIIPQNATVGAHVAEVMSLNDVFMTLATPPNRGDVLGYIGVAREVAAILGQKLNYPAGISSDAAKTGTTNAKGNGGLVVELKDKNCPRYIGRVIKGVKVKPSPDWMVRRLEAVGLRPINNIVDITNYLMFETGHPLHAFDVRHITNSKIIVRPAKDGEVIKLLDGTEKKLRSTDMMITDEKKSLAIAGVMGGEESGVADDTTGIILECACFTPSAIRLTAKSHGILTDSSHRFERGVDFDFMPQVVERATQLFKELADAKEIYETVDAVSSKRIIHTIELTAKASTDFLGVSVTDADIEKLLTPIGFTVNKSGSTLKITAPAFRNDITMNVDIYEEIARINGYDKIPAELPAVVISPDFNDGGQDERLKNNVRNTLKDLGYLETITYSFVPENYHTLLGYSDQDVIKLKNPIIETMKVMRVSLVTSMLESVRYNFDRRNLDLKLFEIGKSYLAGKSGQPGQADPTKRPSPSETVVTEKEYICGVCTGKTLDTADWTRGAKIEKCDFYTAKGEVTALLTALRVPNIEFADMDPKKATYLHPGASCVVKCCGRDCGFIGKIHPDIAHKFDLGDEQVYVFELSFDTLKQLSSAGLAGKELPRFPFVRRDLSFLVSASVRDAQISACIKKAKVQDLREYGVFDLYKGKGVPEDQKSMAYYFVFGSQERTLSDPEVDEAMSKIIDGLKKEFLINMRT
jgi:phenylalanyl-tRNA synthetase beta chain